MRILLVEDSERLQRSISTGLRDLGYAVDQARNGQEGLDFSAVNNYDIIVLDLMLPKIDGLSVLKQMRQRHVQSHVLILSARDQTEDRVQGLDLGADDYLVKPFAFDELVARIRALVRRRVDLKNPVISIGLVKIDTVQRSVSCNGQAIALTPREYILLEYLAQRRGQVLSQDQLLDRLYDSFADITRNAVEVHISALRKKLKAAGAPSLIATRRGFGYFIE